MQLEYYPSTTTSASSLFRYSIPGASVFLAVTKCLFEVALIGLEAALVVFDAALVELEAALVELEAALVVSASI